MEAIYRLGMLSPVDRFAPFAPISPAGIAIETMPSGILETLRLKNLLIKKILAKVLAIVSPFPQPSDVLTSKQPLASSLKPQTRP